MKISTSLRFSILYVGLFVSCSSEVESNQKVIFNNDILSECNHAIQNAVVLDGVTPPVASRRYFYSCVAAYEAIQPFNSKYLSTLKQFNGFTDKPMVDTTLGYCLDLVALSAYTTTARQLVYKEDSVNHFRERKLTHYKNILHSKVFERSIAWGDSIGNAIFRWAKKDTFMQIRGTDFYLAKNDPQLWQPTPLEFMQAVEPKWKRIRPALLDSSSQLRNVLPQPEPYINNNGSSTNKRFNAYMKEVYEASNSADSFKLLTAKYWDDNPNSTFHYGHATIKVLKVSPAGHWLSMFSTVARKQKYSLFQSAEGMLRMSAAMFDGFIAAWDAKYHFEYVRPVTVIRRHIDSSWLPRIETPAFPEYPSAHSVISSAAATVLTSIFGEYPYTDSAENEFGLGVRTFKNFREASDQACQSRLFGGIHFKEGIENGKLLGNAIGEYQLKKLKTLRN